MPFIKPEAAESPQAPPAAPQNRQQKVIQWNVTYPKYKPDDLVLDPDTLSKLLEVVSYFENRELLFMTWGLAERFPQENGLAVKLSADSYKTAVEVYLKPASGRMKLDALTTTDIQRFYNALQSQEKNITK